MLPSLDPFEGIDLSPNQDPLSLMKNRLSALFMAGFLILISPFAVIFLLREKAQEPERRKREQERLRRLREEEKRQAARQEEERWALLQAARRRDQEDLARYVESPAGRRRRRKAAQEAAARTLHQRVRGRSGEPPLPPLP